MTQEGIAVEVHAAAAGDAGLTGGLSISISVTRWLLGQEDAGDAIAKCQKYRPEMAETN